MERFEQNDIKVTMKHENKPAHTHVHIERECSVMSKVQTIMSSV